MWFKNINTGHIWEILDEQLQGELQKNPNFEEVESPVKPNTSKQNNPTKDFTCDICDKTLKNDKALKAHKRMAHKDGDE